MRVNRLKNFFRRYKANFIGREILEEVLQDAIDRLSDFTVTFDENRSQLREFEGDNMQLLEEHLFTAIQNLRAQKYEETIKEIRVTKKVRDQMKVAYQRINDYNFARGLFKKIKLDIDNYWLYRLRFLRVFESQIEKIALAIKEGKYIQAKVLTTYCLGEFDKLDQENTKHNIEIAALHEHVFRLKEICTKTLEWSTYCQEEQLSIDGRIENLLSFLIEKNSLKLVKRLLDDLEELSVPRINFLEIWNAKADRNLNLAELRQSIRNGGWEEGTNYLLLYDSNQIKRELNAIKEYE